MYTLKTMIKLLRYYLETLYLSFSGKNIYWHLVAAVLTYSIVMSGLDWNYFQAVHGSFLYHYLRPALGVGFLIPVILPLLLLAFGFFKKNKSLTHLGWLLAHATSLGWIISSLYKAFTGRVQPNISNLSVDSSHSFHFGFMEHGIFWGWPSSHTTVAFATMIALVTYLGKRYTPLRILAILYAFYVGIAVSFQIHWLSEFVAGAIIGSVIGRVVGNSYKKYKETE